jgi:hypothetical protein
MLLEQKINLQTMQQLQDFFTQCEAACYAGNIESVDKIEITNNARQLAQNLERQLR